MKYIKYIVVVVLGLILISSCSVTTKKSVRTTSFSPNIVQLNQTMDDYELLGEVDVEVEYSRYLGFFTVVHTINGQPKSQSKNVVMLHGTSNMPISFDRHLNKAMFKAYKEYPKADFLMPTLISKETNKLFLGRQVKKEAKIKAYVLKVK